MKTDPAIEAVRRARRQISRECGNDPARLVAHYIELQQEFAGRLVRGPEEGAAQRDAAADDDSVAARANPRS